MSPASCTRRGLVAAAGATLAGMGIPMAAETVIPASGPDIGLFDLIRRHGEARAAMEQAWAAFEAASSRFKSAASPRPDALLWREGDFPRTSYGVGLSTPIEDVEGEEHREYQWRAADWLRGRPVETWFRTLSPALGPECEVRRLEILGACDQWQAERQAVEDSVGLTAAGEVSDAAAELVVDLAVEIAASRPQTLLGLRAFGAWFARQVTADDLHDDFLEQLADAVAGFGGDEA